ncbi:MAG: LuxR C-terminal-related transcriptional regulator [Treponema sp.]|nr:LuxR C-terminal-related transcriptional regulator [Treponema sp.]
MPQALQTLRNIPGAGFHFKRSRLNQVFTEAMKHPIVIICAGAGYGKTTAVHDFVQKYKTSTVWVQLSERDNVGARFWENFSHSMTLVNNAPFAASIKKLGFPDTKEKLKQYLSIIRDSADKKRRIIVFDDCHFIESPAVIRFVEEAICNLPIGTSIFLITRLVPLINFTGLLPEDSIFYISEDELRFSDNEIAQYFREQGVSLQPDNLRKILQDTEGWAFSLNYIARSYKKAPGYDGYIRNAMKSNIFKFMETDIWDAISVQLQNFLVRLSLIDHLSIDLIALLAGDEKDIITELEKQNAYIRRDNYINAYLIHPLFLEFLATKQDHLTKEQKQKTYSIAGQWCFKNEFKIDALSYFEKIKDYKSIVGMFTGSVSQVPFDIAMYAAAIFERVPAHMFDKESQLASTHVRTIMCQGNWEEAIKLSQYYEEKYLKLPEDDEFRNNALGSVYYTWGVCRALMCLTDENYDFDLIIEKQSGCYKPFINLDGISIVSQGPWISAAGSSKKGSVKKYIDAMKRSSAHLSRCFINHDIGEIDLACGELNFYQNDISAALSSLSCAIDRAKERKRSGVIQRVLFYNLRIAVLQGDYVKTDRLLKEMKTLLDDPRYPNRFTDYDIATCWFYCITGLSEKTPDWLKEHFSIYASASFVEDYGNQMKARYCYATRNYPPLLSYIQEMKKREAYLYGRVELLAMEACVQYKMKEKENAYSALKEAYENASGNDIIMPFIELGKDMRTLTAFAQNKTNSKIPKTWLADINRKSASYAKRLAHVTAEYRQANGITDIVVISPREKDILTDLSHGLSRTEIAANRRLSINTVKMLISSVYMKLGAENLADAIRIAAERKIV